VARAAGAQGGGDAAAAEYAAANPTHLSARDAVLRHCGWSLDLIHFFTCGPEEVCWTATRLLRGGTNGEGV
jgi:hypothetical protein